MDMTKEVKKKKRKKKEEKKIPASRIKIIASKLEELKEFHSGILKLKRKEKISAKDWREFRNELEKILVSKGEHYQLSHYWNSVFQIIVNFPGFELSKYAAGAALVAPVWNEYGIEGHWVIEVFPETTKRDVLRAYASIDKKYRGDKDEEKKPRQAVQPEKQTNEKTIKKSDINKYERADAIKAHKNKEGSEYLRQLEAHRKRKLRSS